MEKVVAYIEENKDAFMKGELKRPVLGKKEQLFIKVVAYIEENWEAFVTGKLQRPLQKDNLPVYMWFARHNNDAQKDKLFQKLKDKFEITREEFDAHTKKLFEFDHHALNEVLQGMEDMSLSDNRGNLKDDADL